MPQDTNNGIEISTADDQKKQPTLQVSLENAPEQSQQPSPAPTGTPASAAVEPPAPTILGQQAEEEPPALQLTSSGIPQSTEIPEGYQQTLGMLDEKPWDIQDRERQARHEQERNDNTLKVSEFITDPNAFAGAKFKSRRGKLLAQNTAWMRSQVGKLTPVNTDPNDPIRVALRKKIAKYQFDGVGAESEEAFNAQVVKNAGRVMNQVDLMKTISAQADIAATMPDGSERAFDAFAKKIESHAGYDSTRRAEYMRSFAERQEAMSQQLAPVKPYLDNIWNGYKDTKTGNLDRNVRNSLIELEKDEWDILLRGLRMRAERLPDEEKEAFFSTMNKAFQRSMSDFARNAGEAAGSFVRTQGTSAISDIGGFKPFTTDQVRLDRELREAIKKSNKDAVTIRNRAHEVRNIFRADYDPLDDQGWAGNVAVQIPGVTLTSLTMAVPVAGPLFMGASMTGSAQESMYVYARNQGMSEDDAGFYSSALAPVVMVPQFALEKVKASIWMRKVPGVENAIMKINSAVTNKWGRKAGAFLTISAAEGGIEVLQDITQNTVQEVASWNESFAPEFHWTAETWESIKSFPEMAASMMVLSGIGTFRHSRVETSNKALKSETTHQERVRHGFRPEDSKAIANAKNQAELNAAVEQAWENRDYNSESAKQAREEEMEKRMELAKLEAEARASGNMLPRLQYEENGTWSVIDQESGEIIASGLDGQGARDAAAAHSTLLDENMADTVAKLADMMEGIEGTKAKGQTTVLDPFLGVNEKNVERILKGGEKAMMGQAALEGQSTDGRTIYGVSQTEFSKRGRNAVNRIWKGGNILTVFHEEAHAIYNLAKRSGNMTYERALQALRDIDAGMRIDVANKRFIPKNQRDAGATVRLIPEDFDTKNWTQAQREQYVDEKIAELMEAETLRRRNVGGIRGNVRGKTTDGGKVKPGLIASAIKNQLREGGSVKELMNLRGFINVIRNFFGIQMARSYEIQKGIKEGRIDEAKLDQFVSDLYGLSAQEELEARVDQVVQDILDGKAETAGDPTFSMSPPNVAERDRMYLRAVETGDEDEMRRLVNESAEEAGYDDVAWRGDARAKDGEFPNKLIAPVYLSKDESVAYYFASATDPENNPRRFYIKRSNTATREDLNRVIENAYKGSSEELRGKVLLDILNSSGIENADILRGFFNAVDRLGPNTRQWSVSYITKQEAKDMLKAGFDSVEGAMDYGGGAHSTEMAVFNAGQVKLADLVTRDDAGNVIPLSQRFDQDNMDIRYSMQQPGTQLFDDLYMQRVEAGDMQAAQQMVDMAAKDAGYGVKSYHGTGEQFNVFSETDGSDGDIGFHFGSKTAATDRLNDVTAAGKRNDRRQVSSPRLITAYLSLNNPLRLKENRLGVWHDIDILNQIFDNENGGKNPHPSFESDQEAFYNDELEVNITNVFGETESVSYFDAPVGSRNAWMDSYLKSKGFDGIVYKNEVEDKGSDSYIVFDPSQIKVADPVTRDDAGNVIPLSERFNPETSDIRFQMSAVATPSKEIPMSAVKVLHADSDVLPKPSKKIKNEKVAEKLAEIAQEFWGRKLTSADITPEEIELITQMGVDEFIAAFQASGKNAADWYSTAIETAMAVAGVIHPELNNPEVAAENPGFSKAKHPDQAADLVMRIALAVTSQNLSVNLNTRFAEEQFEAFKRTGKFDTSKVYGEKGESIQGNLQLANTIIDVMGFDKAREFIEDEFTVRDLQAAIEDAVGFSVNIAGKMDDIVNGAAIFGPKIGQGFLQNVMGKFWPVTIDLWMRRTWGRWTGDVVGNGATAERLARLLDGAREAGLDIGDLKSLRVVERKRKSGSTYRTMTEKVKSDLENDIEFGQKVLDVTRRLEKLWQEHFRLIRTPMSKDRLADLKSGKLSYKQFIKAQEKVKASLEKAHAKHKGEARKKGEKAMPKAKFAERWYADQGLNQVIQKAGEYKPEWANAAGVIVNNLKPIDIPGPQDRRVISQVVNSIRERLESQGYSVTNADVQAVLWYPEKDLWAKLRGEDESNLKSSYDEAFLQIAEQRGLGKQARAVARNLADARNGAARSGRSAEDGQAAQEAGPKFSLSPVAQKGKRSGAQVRWRPAGSEGRVQGQRRGSVLDAERFSDVAGRNKSSHKFGTSVDVYSPEDYDGYDLILLEKDGESASISISPTGEVGSVTKSAGATAEMVEDAFDAAIATGNVKWLNGFDTILPKIYSDLGFKTVARIPFNPEFKPDGWDYDTYRKFNNGQPDVVFMLYTGVSGIYEPGSGVKVNDYDQAAVMAQAKFDSETAFSMAPPGTAPAFYSQMERVINSKLQGKSATPQQILAVIDPSKGSGVKAEEIKWTGIEAKIEELAEENIGKVPLDELRAWMAVDGQIKFTETIYREEGAGGPTREQLRLEAKFAALGYRLDDLSVDENGMVESYIIIKDGEQMLTIDGEQISANDLEDEAAMVLDEIISEAESEAVEQETQYRKWSTEGGYNYKEQVLNMPGAGQIEGVFAFRTVDDAEEFLGDLNVSEFAEMDYGWADQTDSSNAKIRIGNTSKAIFDKFKQWADGRGGWIHSFVETGSPETVYKSRHFADAPNYLAHMRTQEWDDNGQGLLIEETQSDRHQAGRKKGYIEDAEGIDPKDRLRELRQQEAELSGKIYEQARKDVMAIDTSGIDADLVEEMVKTNWQTRRADNEEWAQIQTEILNLEMDIQKGRAAVPDAPFRKDWHMAMFKRALYQAVAKGKDWIAWVDGQIQADRYDLSKQVDVITWNKEDGQLNAWKGGDAILTRNAKESDLEGLIGKEAAKNLIEAKASDDGFRRIAGDQLQVGGQGMKAFYDKMLPSAVQKYVKKWGAKVERGSIENDKGNSFGVWKVKITDEMRRSVEIDGQPMFQMGPAAMADQVQSSILRAAKKQPIMQAKIFQAMLEKMDKIQKLIEETGRAFNFDAFGKPYEKEFDQAREDLLNAAAILEALAQSLPPEIRGKVPISLTTMAKYETDEERLDYIKRRLKRMRDVAEDWMSNEINESLIKLVKMAEAKRKGGEKATGTLGAEGHRYFGKVAEVMEMTEDEVEGLLAALDKKIAETESDEEILNLSEEYRILLTFGNFKNKKLGEMASGLADAAAVYKSKRSIWKMKEEARLAEVRRLTQVLLNDLGNPKSSDVQRVKKVSRQFIKSMAEGKWSLMSFQEVLEEAFGPDSEITRRWSRRIRNAQRQRTSAIFKANKRWKNAIEAATGKKGRAARKIIWDMKTEQTVEATQRPITTQRIKVPIDTLFDAEKQSALGLTKDEIAKLTAEFESLDSKSRVKNLYLEREVEGEPDTVQYTESEAIFMTMLFAQEEYRAPLRKHGMGEEFQEELENGLSNAAKSIRDFLTQEYGEAYEPLRQRFEAMYGVDLRSTDNYSPGRFYSTGSGQEMDVTGSGFIEGGFKTSFIKDRKKHMAEAKPEDAFSLYFSHLNQTEHYKAMAELSRELHGILGRPEVKKALAGTDQNLQQVMNQWLEAIDGNGLNLPGDGKFMEWIGRTQAYLALAWKMSTTLKNLFGAAINATYKMPMNQFIRGAARLMAGQIEFKQVWDSDIIQNRLEGGFSPEVRAAVSQALGERPSLRGDFLVAGMQVIGTADAFGTAFGAAIAYDYHLNQALKNHSPEVAKALALEMVAELVSQTAQPVEVTDRSLMEMRLRGIGKFAFIFASEARQKTSLWINAMLRTVKGKPTMKDARVILISHLVVAPLMHTITAALRDLRSPEEDDEDIWDPMGFLTSVIAGPLGGMPLVRDVVDGFRGESGPLKRFVDSATAGKRLAYDMLELDEDQDIEKDMDWYESQVTKMLQGLGPFPAVGASVFDQIYDVITNLGDED